MTSQGKAKQHIWTDEEDACIVASLIELYTLGTYNADNGFRAGYLGEVGKMIRQKLPTLDIKARPHIESRLKTLKNDFIVVYDMIYGGSTSGFGWDHIQKCVVAEQAVWDAYVKSHPRAIHFRNKHLDHFDDLCVIWVKDRANGKNVETPIDVVEELDGDTDNVCEPKLYYPTIYFFNSYYTFFGASGDESSPYTHMSANRNEGTSSGVKRRKVTWKDNENIIDNIRDLVSNLGEKIKETGIELSKAIRLKSDERREAFYTDLRSREGLTTRERYIAGDKLGSDDNRLMQYFSLSPDERVEFVRCFL